MRVARAYSSHQKDHSYHKSDLNKTTLAAGIGAAFVAGSLFYSFYTGNSLYAILYNVHNGINLLIYVFTYFLDKNQHVLLAKSEPPKQPPVDIRKDLPVYTLDDVMQHTTAQTRIWVTYGQGVYDITEFVPQHPGGSEKISMAAGTSIEPFWMLYGVHKNPNVLAILEKYRIGVRYSSIFHILDMNFDNGKLITF